MLGTFSFKCPACGHAEDRFIHRDERDSQICEQRGDDDICGVIMQQVIHHAPKLDWYAMAMGESAGPEFIDRFERDHKNRKAHEERIEREHGDYGPAAGS